MTEGNGMGEGSEGGKTMNKERNRARAGQGQRGRTCNTDSSRKRFGIYSFLILCALFLTCLSVLTLLAKQAESCQLYSDKIEPHACIPPFD